MALDGLSLASRYSYPPNSLSLCGPAKQKDLAWYTQSQQTDLGTKEILEQFSTLYPYLCFIAGENHLKNPFETRVIEAYWIGNSLLNTTKKADFLHFLDDELELSKKTPKKDISLLKTKVVQGALPHHAFHVLNIYRRTGNMDIPHTVETMDACIINWGKIVRIDTSTIMVETRPLRNRQNTLTWGDTMHRKLRSQGELDSIFPTLKIGDIVSYHWGYICEKLTPTKHKNLQLYTSLAIQFANQTV